MHLYLNYAVEHWVQPAENPPVGIILCAGKGEALVRYATEGLPNKMLVREYLTALPDEKVLAAEIAIGLVSDWRVDDETSVAEIAWPLQSCPLNARSGMAASMTLSSDAVSACRRFSASAFLSSHAV